MATNWWRKNRCNHIWPALGLSFIKRTPIMKLHQLLLPHPQLLLDQRENQTSNQSSSLEFSADRRQRAASWTARFSFVLSKTEEAIVAAAGTNHECDLHGAGCCCCWAELLISFPSWRANKRAKNIVSTKFETHIALEVVVFGGSCTIWVEVVLNEWK